MATGPIILGEVYDDASSITTEAVGPILSSETFDSITNFSTGPILFGETFDEIAAISTGPVLFGESFEQLIFNINAVCIDQTSGQERVLDPTDILVDTTLVPLIQDAKQILSITTGIDATTVATTPLFTVPAGNVALVTEALVFVSAATAITVPAEVGVGIAAGEDDIIASTPLIGITDTDQFASLDVSDIARSGQASETISFGVDVGATGTSQTLSVLLIGIIN